MSAAVERWQPPTLERLTVDQVKFIAGTDIVPKHLRGNPAAIMAVILKGRALGLDDIHALTAIHFIEGKPTLSAETMTMLARRAGHSITGETSDAGATVRGRRADTGDEMTVVWTMEDAARAGLAGKDTWKRYPRQMLWARAVSELCRQLFGDVLAGAAYTPDEAELSAEDRVSEAIGRVGPPADDHSPDDVVDAAAVEEASPAMDAEGQQSTFAQMAEHATTSRRRKAEA